MKASAKFLALALLLSAVSAVAPTAALPPGLAPVTELSVQPQKPGARPLRARFVALGRRFDLLLVPVEGAAAPGVPLYRGRVRGEP
ncbi:MAG TPA: hypothetical protein VL049_05645, partial [Candidatus Dormibacteraeota bacterium]|nr:hypothetical protein [Candidatus Dormibacteraeota bacterium]